MTSDTSAWFEQWWIELPKHHFTSHNKGSKAECLKEIEKLDPDEKLMEHITWFTRERALRTAKLKQKNIKVAGWKHAVRLVKYRFWDDDLESVATEQAKIAATQCSECENDATIQGKCWSCRESTDPQYQDHMQWLYDTLVSQGLGVNEFPDKAAWITACKERTIHRLAKLRAERDMAQAVSQ